MSHPTIQTRASFLKHTPEGRKLLLGAFHSAAVVEQARVVARGTEIDIVGMIRGWHRQGLISAEVEAQALAQIEREAGWSEREKVARRAYWDHPELRPLMSHIAGLEAFDGTLASTIALAAALDEATWAELNPA